MKKVLMVFAVCAFVSPLFSACAEKCAKDDHQCIADCVNDYAKDKCGVRLDGDFENYSLKDLACVMDLGSSKSKIDKIGDTCIEDYNGDEDFYDWD
ncbi:MAG: hypothetical protein IJ268_05950 [Proteobacteria bacterium]|nr:hypothetical protein [Pseudomonadota bacterium]MBQ9241711.1 hypothetical protein [Pseudomonadota bacterium]